MHITLYINLLVFFTLSGGLIVLFLPGYLARFKLLRHVTDSGLIITWFTGSVWHSHFCHPSILPASSLRKWVSIFSYTLSPSWERDG